MKESGKWVHSVLFPSRMRPNHPDSAFQARILPLAVLVSALISTATGLVSTRQIVRSNRRWTSLGRFEFQSGGGVEVNTSSIIVYSPERASPTDSASIGFVLAEAKESAWIEGQDPEFTKDLVCPLTSLNVTVLFRLHDMQSPGEGGRRPPKLVTAAVPRNGLYTLYFINCISSRLVTATVQVSMWNTGPASVRLYLPPGEFYLAIVDIVVAGLFVLLVAWWLFQVLKIWCQAVMPPGYQVLLTLALPLLAATAVFMGMCLLMRQAYGSSPSWDWLTDCLIMASACVLLAAFLLGFERVDAYLTDLERMVVYIAVPIWLVCQTGLLMARNAGILAQMVSPDSVFWSPMVEQLEAGVLFSLSVLTVLLSFEVLGFCCSMVLLKRGGRQAQRDDRGEDSPMSKFYVKMSFCIIGTSGVAFLLRQYLPFYLTWLADALCLLSFFAFMAYTMNRVRPRLEKSVYQLFDENDDMDEELAEL